MTFSSEADEERVRYGGDHSTRISFEMLRKPANQGSPFRAPVDMEGLPCLHKAIMYVGKMHLLLLRSYTIKTVQKKRASQPINASLLQSLVRLMDTDHVEKTFRGIARAAAVWKYKKRY